jgi:putative endonuclease
MNPGHAYIVGSATGTLYIGVTSELHLRICQHKLGVFPGFSKTYGCHRLLLAEPFNTITEAIAREKQLKGWTRAKKLDLIRKTNPEFKDLAETWTYPHLGPARKIADQK